MGVHELLDFTLGNDVGCIRQNLHHAQAAGVHHHLEGARIRKIAYQHAGRVAKAFGGRGAAAAQGSSSTTSSCSNVAVWMNSTTAARLALRQVEALRPLVAQGAAHQQQQGEA